MVKLVDPTLPFANVIALHRREQAAATATTFGLWASTHDWRTLYPEPTAAGLLVDLGFQVCPVRAITSGMLPHSLLVWVAGENTTRQESEQLSSFNVAGVWIGSAAEAADGWACLEPRVFGDRAQFVQQFVAAVASLVEVPEAAYVSNNLSNEPRRTDPDDAGRVAARNVADLHEHGRRRTTTDPPGGQTAGS